MDQTNQSICPSVSAHRFFPLYLPTNFCPSFCPSLSDNYFCPPFLLIILPIISAYHTVHRFCPSFLPIILPVASAHHFCLSYCPSLLPIASAYHFCLSYFPSLLPLASAYYFYLSDCPSLLPFASAPRFCTSLLTVIHTEAEWDERCKEGEWHGMKDPYRKYIYEITESLGKLAMIKQKTNEWANFIDGEGLPTRLTFCSFFFN